NYAKKWVYSFMGDFLAENAEPRSDGGCCYPMMLLAVQLGRRAGLALFPVWSETHVSVFADIGEGLLYEPSWSLRADGTVNVSKVLLPPETHILGYRAPRQTLVGLSDLVINQSLADQIVADFSEGRERDAALHL